jgi:hypothetical protein
VAAGEPGRLVVRVKDGRGWRIGSDDDVAWIRQGTSISKAITAAIPPLFDAYATVELPMNREEEQQRHDRAVVALLSEHSGPQPWWLGYLDTGADDIVFPDAPTVTLYSGWRYVLVEAGPQQAASWRHGDARTFWKGSLPSLIFPADRSWLISTLWDDDWTCVGGSTALVASLLGHRDLRGRTRLVAADQDATPPGHQAL